MKDVNPPRKPRKPRKPRCPPCVLPACPSNTGRIIAFVMSLITAYAVYLSFVKNNGFNFAGFLGASLAPMIYIPWKLAGK